MPKPHPLERSLDLHFKNRALLERALTHPSYLNEHPGEAIEDYERLEFLGDAFLGWVIANELFRRRPGFTEGDLTRARAALVRGTSLAGIAVRLDLGQHLVMGAGEEATGGRTRRSNLAAVVEALIGAVLLDRGEPAARKLVLRWIGDKLDALDSTGAPRDSKSALQEACQKRGLALPVYELIEESGPSHDRTYRVSVLAGRCVGTGEGRRKVEAEQAAATEALAALERVGE